MPNAPIFTAAPRMWGRAPVSQRVVIGLLVAAVALLGPLAPALLADAADATPSVTVGDRVWVDRNGNGLQDSGEPGIRGVYVTLTTGSGGPVTDVNGKAVSGARTDGSGYYAFDDLPPGKYIAHVDNGQVDLRDYKPTQSGVGGDRGADSSNGRADSADLQNDGDRDLSLDFGFTADNPRVMLSMNPSALKDLDGNGPDAGDTIRYGFDVTNTGNTPLTSFELTSPMNLQGLSCPAVTLQPGESLECAPVTYTLTQDDIDRGYVDGDSTITASTPDGQKVSDRDCPVTDATARAVSVGDFVWLDLDKDGVQDSGEPGIAGVTVSIVGPTGRAVNDVYGDPVGTRTTDSDGRYVFAKLPALPIGQHYTVRVDNGQAALNGYTPTQTGQGTRATDSSNGSAESTDLNKDGASDMTLDFGFTRPSVSVGDFVWVDVDEDGIQDAGEPGLRGVQVTLVGPNGQAVRDITGAAVGPQTTDANGAYMFDRLPTLPAGQHYTVRVDNAQAALRDYTPTQAGAGNDRAQDSSTGSSESGDLTADGASDRTLDFGYTFSGPGIKLDKTAGPVVDLDGNGHDAGDTITYTFKVTNVGKQTLTNVTIADPKVGAVTCPTAPLAPGASVDCSSATYTLTVADVRAGKVVNQATVTGTAPDGRKVTDDDSTTTPVTPRQVSVGDFVWVDSDRDGVQDAGEPGLKGVVLTIVGPDGQPVRDVQGNPVGPQTTDERGAYAFTKLPALPAGQHYTVRVDNAQPALNGYVPTQTGQGTRATDSSNGSAESGDLNQDGASDKTLDFGFVTDKPAIQLDKIASAITDVDGNGPDAGDTIVYDFVVTNIGSVTLDPVTVADPKVGPVVCPAGPLAPGSSTSCDPVTYTLTAQDIAAGAVQNTATATGTAPDGTKVTDDDSTSTPVTPAAVSVGDFVWIDSDRDGVQDAGEPGLAGVVVTIVGPNGQAVTGIDGQPVGPRTTDADGAYTFEGLPALPAGQHYTVKVDRNQPALAGYVPTLAEAGNDPTKDSSTDSAESVDLTEAGDRDDTLDFGFVKPAVSVGDFVWLDSDRDGLQDAGEPGIPGVQLTLVGPNGQAVTNVNGQPVGAATTDANGAYTFTNLPVLAAGQSYTVRLDGAQPALQPYTPTQAGVGSDRGVDSSTGSAASTGLTENGQRDPSLDFGFVAKAGAPKVSVGDFVWNDLDSDGIQDSGEPGIPGVVLTIVGPGGQPVVGIDGQTVGPQTTDANGAYSFVNLPALAADQGYTVRVDNAQAALAGYRPTQAGAGNDRALDSSTGSAASTGLTQDGQRDPSLDFGFVRGGTPNGPAIQLDKTAGPIQDLDGNGPDAGDRIRFTFAVTNTGNVVLDPVTVSDPKVGPVTCPTGPLAPGATVQCGPVDYTITAADVASGSVQNTAIATGTPPTGPNVTDDDSTSTPVTPRAKVSVGDFVWRDSDRDGVQDAGEPGIQGVQLTIVGPNGQPVTDVNGQAVGPQTTDANGAYTFANLPVLPAGQHYTVRLDNGQTALNGLVPTVAGQGTRATDSSTGSAESTDLTTDGASDPTLDFGFVTPTTRPAVSVGDFVWIDTDGDGVQDAGEPGLSGVTVTIVGPNGQAVTNVDGVPVGPSTTDATGKYTFTGLPTLPAGQHYTVRIDNTQQALRPYQPTLPGQGADRGLDSSSGSAESGDLTTAGASDLTLDFGFTPRPKVSVGDFVWRDLDRDGVQDAGEPGITGVQVTLVGPTGQPVTDVNGRLVGPATTNAQGAYAFIDLPALPAGQHYTVRIDNAQAALAGLAPTVTGQGTRATDSSTGSAESTDLTTNGASDATLDFGFVTNPGPNPAVSVGDFVWVDTDGDGVQDAGEPGLAGITVTIVGPNGQAVTNVDGQPVGPVVTDAGGRYTFTGLPTLPAGQHYTVRIDNTQPALAAYAPTQTGQGTRATDSSNGSAESTDLTTAGASDTTLDFGFTPRPDGQGVSVGDFLWVDANRNGVQDAGERGLAGITVTLVGPNGQAVTGVNGQPVGPQVTGANGEYAFTGLPVLPAGQHYTVRVDNTQPALAGYRPTVTGQGTPTTDSSNGSAESGDLTTPGASDTSLDFGFVPVGDGIAAILLDKRASEIDDVDANGDDAGDLITYTFVVTNTGDRDLENVAVTDPKVGAVTCPATTLAVGASMTCTAAPYALTAQDVASGTVENTAIATATPTPTPADPDPAPVADEDSTSTPVVPAPEIVLDKSVTRVQDVNGGGIGADDLIVYSFDVINPSNVTISDITVTDPKVGAVTCPATQLAAGTSMTCTAAPYVITAADVAAGAVDNTAVVDGKTPDGTPVTDDDSTTTDVKNPPKPQPEGPDGDGGDVNGDDYYGGGGFFGGGSFLPNTGGPAGLLLWLASGALLVGTALVVRNRRNS